MFKLNQYFNAYVITVRGWEENRLQPFLTRAKELGVEGFDIHYGADGEDLITPNWWVPNRRKWACHLAHVACINDSIARKNGLPVLIVEDDAFLKANFVEAIQEVIAYYRDHPTATVCYLGGKVHGIGTQVSRLIFRDLQVGGGWAYTVAPQHAATVAAYMMDDPRVYMKPRARDWVNDTKMMHHSEEHSHAVTRPTCVGHRGGASVILQRNRKPIDV